MKNLTVKIEDAQLQRRGNWTTARDLFPELSVDQDTAEVSVRRFDAEWDPKYGGGKTHECDVEISADGQAMFVRGMCGYRNERRRVGGRQKFCYAIFRGDSGHIYIHRATASAGWMAAAPETITRRLRTLGIGADRGVIQQGDFLLKPANGRAFPDEEFRHEYMGSGHHTFELPVLRAYAAGVSQVLITTPTRLHHEPVDGIQHPEVIVPPGKYIIGTTSAGLAHDNRRD